MPKLVFLTRSSSPIFDKTRTRVFLVSGFLVKSLINKYCHSSRASNHTDMKLGPLTELDKRNILTSSKCNNNIMPANYDFLVLYLIYGWFEAIQKPDSRSMVYGLYVSINGKYLRKNKKRTEKSLTQLSCYCFK